jgi:hypothetical protein
MHKGALVRLPSGGFGQVTECDPAHDKLEIGPAPRAVIAIRRQLGRWPAPRLRVEPLPPGRTPQWRGKDLSFAEAVRARQDEYNRVQMAALDRVLLEDGSDPPPPPAPWWSRLLCRLGLHDWRNGPGEDCTVCGRHDDIWCECYVCRTARGRRA